jgi:hypothetical protein
MHRLATKSQTNLVVHRTVVCAHVAKRWAGFASVVISTPMVAIPDRSIR